MHLENIVNETLGVKDHRVVKIDSSTENIVMHIEDIKRRNLPCDRCGMRATVADRILREREFLHVPLWGIAVFLWYRPRRVRFPQCGVSLLLPVGHRRNPETGCEARTEATGDCGDRALGHRREEFRQKSAFHHRPERS